MKLSRQVGTTNQKINLFIQDATATTGVGLAGVLGSTVSYGWFRDDSTGVSTGVASTAGSLGVYSTSAWVQASSSNALGWYQFGCPDGMFASGGAVSIHFYAAPNMVVVPVEIELTKTNNQQYASSTVFLAHTSTSPANVVQVQGSNAVTSAAGVLSVDVDSIQGSNAVTTAAGILSTDNRSIWGSATVTSAAGVQSTDNRSIFGQTTVTTAAGRLSIDVGTIRTSAAVTSAAGILTVSTQTIDKTGYDVTSFYGSPAVTSAAGILNTSTQTLSAAGSDIQSIYGSPIVTTAAGIMSTDNRSIWGSGTVTTAAGVQSVNIRTIVGSNAVTSGAGILNVSTQSLAGIVVSTQTIDKTGYALTAGERAAIAGVVLTTTQPESYRSVNAEGSVMQLMYEVLSNITEQTNSGTTRALASVTSHTVTGLEYQYNDSSAPASISRIA